MMVIKKQPLFWNFDLGILNKITCLCNGIYLFILIQEMIFKILKSSIMPCSALYIHWPYCEVKCPYCDFNSFAAPSKYDVSPWVSAYKEQLDYFASHTKVTSIDTIFLGGGTPSLMPTAILEELFAYIQQKFHIENDAEITFEANPSSVESKKFNDFKALGFNRVSIGVQSFDDKVLQFLGRVHNSKDAMAAIHQAQKIFDNYSFDLIYGTAYHTIQQWQQELNLAQQLRGNHLSCYQLTIEKGTEFYRMHKQNKLPIIDNDIAYEFYAVTNDILEQQGLGQYEISNYAKPGFECKHNVNYWKYGQYIGIGPGAHSRVVINDKLCAVMMYHNPTKWLQSSMQSHSYGIQNQVALTNEEIMSEQLMMGLRLTNGINIEPNNIHTKDTHTLNLRKAINYSRVQEYEAEGLLRTINSNKGHKSMTLTAKGLALHSYLVPRLLAN